MSLKKRERDVTLLTNIMVRCLFIIFIQYS